MIALEMGVPGSESLIPTNDEEPSVSGYLSMLRICDSRWSVLVLSLIHSIQ